MMRMTLELVLGRETLKVTVWKLERECNLVGNDFLPLSAQYPVRAPLSVDDFPQFVVEREEKDVEVPNANIGGRIRFLACLSGVQGSRDAGSGSAPVSNSGLHMPEEARGVAVEVIGLQPFLLFSLSWRLL
jgi:hypothetical protein